MCPLCIEEINLSAYIFAIVVSVCLLSKLCYLWHKNILLMLFLSCTLTSPPSASLHDHFLYVSSTLDVIFYSTKGHLSYLYYFTGLAILY